MSEVASERLIIGIEAVVEEELRLERVSGAWTKILGMLVKLESERPLTPILKSSNSFIAFAWS